ERTRAVRRARGPDVLHGARGPSDRRTRGDRAASESLERRSARRRPAVARGPRARGRPLAPAHVRRHGARRRPAPRYRGGPGMTVQDSTAAAPGPGRAFEAQAALDPIEPKTGKAKKPRPPQGVKTTWRAAFRKDWQLYSLVILPLLFFLVFRYLPMAGNVIAFRRFRAGSGNIFGDEWVGLHYV